MQRKAARENTFLLVFESVCKTDETAEEIFTNAVEVRGLEVDDYVKSVFFGIHTNLKMIEETVNPHLCGWKKERISPASLALIRLATYEMLFMEDIPSRVSINEAVELSKKYDDEKTYTFVNGVLHAVATSLSENG